MNNDNFVILLVVNALAVAVIGIILILSTNDLYNQNQQILHNQNQMRLEYSLKGEYPNITDRLPEINDYKNRYNK